MTDPKTLKVGDLVRFTSLPDEWSQPKHWIAPKSRAFMKVMIRRTWPARIARIDEYGSPWIDARIKQRGRYVEHCWAIIEKTGWRRVQRRD